MASKVFRKSALDRLASPEQLDQLVQVTPPQGWAALGILAGVMVAGVLWGWFGSIPMEVTADGLLQSRASQMDVSSSSPGEELEAVLLLPPDSPTKVAAGMEAHIFFSDANPEEFGFIVGYVRGVDVVRGNGNSWRRVEVSLKRDQHGAYVYSGSLSPRPAWFLSNGTRITGKILVHRNRPLTLLIPGLREVGGA